MEPQLIADLGVLNEVVQSAGLGGIVDSGKNTKELKQSSKAVLYKLCFFSLNSMLI